MDIPAAPFTQQLHVPAKGNAAARHPPQQPRCSFCRSLIDSTVHFLQVRETVHAFYGSSYAACLQRLEALKPQLMLDVHLAVSKHVHVVTSLHGTLLLSRQCESAAQAASCAARLHSWPCTSSSLALAVCLCTGIVPVPFPHVDTFVPGPFLQSR